MNTAAGNQLLPKVVITCGDPSGIGPDIILQALQQPFNAVICVLGDPSVLADRTRQTGQQVQISEIDSMNFDSCHRPGILSVDPEACASPVVAGEINSQNADQVIRCITKATDLCLKKTMDAMVTAPVNKAMINDGGINFSGHTEWIARLCGEVTPVMMLANAQLRVCLATTHLPLAEVPRAITAEGLRTVLEVMHRDIGILYDLKQPVIGVCGLNPHAGENGYLGKEEQLIISPTLATLREEGLSLIGPLPADTAFTSHQLASLDAVLAMYHDQGLPVIKHQGFGEVVNVTLGLPIIRTSVDHGTAYSLAGTGEASADSLVSSINLAIRFANNRRLL